MSEHSFRRRYPNLAAIMPSLEERSEMDAAQAERFHPDRVTVCPICADEIDPRLRYCSAECCGIDEGVEVSP